METRKQLHKPCNNNQNVNYQLARDSTTISYSFIGLVCQYLHFCIKTTPALYHTAYYCKARIIIMNNSSCLEYYPGE